ncbi:MAG: MFS transporter [Acidobacteria bacterium RBG_16_68_9]|nr:MAG: MFS transporter [Acidobacteria bacterium RBG_16_68_9]
MEVSRGRHTDVLRGLTADGRLLFGTRVARLFAYGWLSVVLVLYLAQVGLTEVQIGLLLTLTLIGDTVISLWITTHADRVGRRRMLIAGATLMILAGGFFALTDSFLILVVAATVGVISPSGNEVGPFLPIEQAALSQTLSAKRRTQAFAWYNLVGSFATALGALAAGTLVQALQSTGVSALVSYRFVVVGYAATGGALVGLFARLSPQAEAPPSPSTAIDHARWGLHRSRGVVFRLTALFSLDAFAGGLVLQSLVAYWFHIRFGVEPALLGSIFFGANILAGLSALSAAWVARRIGLVNTMVFTHLPSNILLMLVPLMPNLPLAIGVLLLRFSLSQMDVPTRQSYTMAVVDPDERSTASGLTGVARTIGTSFAPLIATPLLANPALLSVPFFLSGGLKIVYDLLLYRSFRALKPPEEEPTAEGGR